MTKLISSIAICFALLLPLTAEQKKAKMTPEAVELMAKIGKASGVGENVKKIKTMTQKATMTVLGMNITGKIAIMAKGDKMHIETKMASMVETQILDGEEGWAESMTTGIRKLSTAELLTLQGDSLKYMFNQEDFFDEIQLAGKEQFNGEECYKFIYIKEGLKPTQNFFSVKTLLPVGEKQVIASPMGEMPTTVTIKKLVKHELGFLYPSQIEQSMGAMKMKLSIDSFSINDNIDDAIFEKPQD
ncbi:MAG: hypothetical protein NE334_12460 [Lentisphaeraceae bacterium]|nr:hypothetical protein [Lentisphaeraceae bacterium]